MGSFVNKFGLLIALPCLATYALGAPTQESSSPLVPMVWTQDTSWTITAALPSPDCDFALELRGSIEGNKQPIRWAKMDGTGEPWRTELSFPSPEVGEWTLPSHFYYSPAEGFLPLVVRYRSAQSIAELLGPGSEVVAILSGYYSASVNILSTPNKLPIFINIVLNNAGWPWFDLTEGNAYLYQHGIGMSELGRYPDIPKLYRDSDGNKIYLVTAGGRLGFASDRNAMRPTGPAIEGISDTSICTASRSPTKSAVLYQAGYQKLKLATWNESVSHSVTLKDTTKSLKNLSYSGPFVTSRGPTVGWLLQPLPRDRWIALRSNGAELTVWMVEGSSVRERSFAAGWVDWAIDLSVPNDPLLAISTEGEGSSGGLRNHSTIGVLKWREELGDWEFTGLASLDAERYRLGRVAVGRDARGVGTVCFSDGPVADSFPGAITTYRVAIPSESPTGVPGNGWVLYQ